MNGGSGGFLETGVEVEKVFLIVPCYNEAQRLPVEEFKKYVAEGLQVLFADDGSTDQTWELIEGLSKWSPYIHTYQAPRNFGKAGVIQAAYLDAMNRGLLGAVEWIGYWDADLATPLFEVENMLKYSRFISSPQPILGILGSRVYRLGSHIVRSSLRHYLGRLFATYISFRLKIRTYDSQCGAKIFRREVADRIFSSPFLSRWIFDVEILFRLGQENLVEYPLQQWMDVPGSKVKILREILRVLGDIERIRYEYL